MVCRRDGQYRSSVVEGAGVARASGGQSLVGDGGGMEPALALLAVPPLPLPPTVPLFIFLPLHCPPVLYYPCNVSDYVGRSAASGVGRPCAGLFLPAALVRSPPPPPLSDVLSVDLCAISRVSVCTYSKLSCRGLLVWASCPAGVCLHKGFLSAVKAVTVARVIVCQPRQRRGKDFKCPASAWQGSSSTTRATLPSKEKEGK